MIRLEKIVNHNRTYLGKDGKEHPSTNFYLVLPTTDGNEKRVCIRAAFGKDRPSDNVLLDLYSKLVVIAKDDEKSVEKNGK